MQQQQREGHEFERVQEDWKEYVGGVEERRRKVNDTNTICM